MAPGLSPWSSGEPLLHQAPGPRACGSGDGDAVLGASQEGDQDAQLGDSHVLRTLESVLLGSGHQHAWVLSLQNATSRPWSVAKNRLDVTRK